MGDSLAARKIVWFSCGAASAVVAKIAVKKDPDTLVAYCDTNSEHPDNKRFLRDVETWIDKEIIILKSDKYQDIWDVFEKKRYLSGIRGAPCTVALKSSLRQRFQKPNDTHSFGFTSEEIPRATRFEYNNPELETYWPLIEHYIDKNTCLGTIKDAGIEIPAMYKLGYPNNNCIGCVKASSLGYWNKIKIDFPDVFNRMAKIERKLKATINKSRKGGKVTRVYLDELTPDMGRGLKLPDISCGLLCQNVLNEISGNAS